jgi:hypothetical protein
LDRPLKVGGGIQPRLVTVLTPATTFTVGQDFIQNRRAVNSRATFIKFLNDFSVFELRNTVAWRNSGPLIRDPSLEPVGAD